MDQAKSPGRPSGRQPDQVRRQLLDAARGLFAGNEFTAVSVKRIARRAGVNSAMIHYYFGDKRGLYLAIAEEVLGPLMTRLQHSGEDPGGGLEEFIQGYTELLMANPWWPGFLLREIVYGSEDFLGSFAEKFRERMRNSLLARITEEVEGGRLRPDLDPKLTMLSLIGLLVFPFLAQPLANRVLDLELQGLDARSLAAHTAKLFLQGVSADD